MPAKWQKWMPFHIDSFYGSPWVQAMHPAAQSGYLKLLAAQWQTDDCTLPTEQEDLSILSGLGQWGESWTDHSKAILRHFTKTEDGRLQNVVCFREWLEAKRIFEARQSGRKGKTHESVIDQSSKKSDTRTDTETVTKTEKHVSEAKASSPRIDSGMPDPIQEIYLAYPRKVGKGAAIKAIKRAVQHLKGRGMPIREAQGFLWKAVSTYARSPAGKGRYVPNPATWFNQGRYDDDQAQWQETQREGNTNGNGNRPQSRTGLEPGDAEEVAEIFRRIQTGEAYSGDGESLHRPAPRL